MSRNKNIFKFSENDFPLWPIWDKSEERSLLGVLHSGLWAGTRASKINEFSKTFATFQDTAHGICLSNGTVTLEAALVACGIGEGDEVIVPSISFVSTASAVLRVNATPIIVDVNQSSLCIDCNKIEEAVTKNTKAIIAVHVAGMMCDMDFLKSFCDQKKLFFIEDCAHSHGSKWNNKGAGSYGHFGSFSFQHSKLLSAGEGGFLTSNSKSLIEKAWNYSNCGREIGKDTYFHSSIGSNCRMTDWQAAILTSQLERYPTQLLQRNKAAKILDGALSKIDGLSPQARDSRISICGYYCYIFHLDSKVFGSKAQEKFFTILANSGVPLSLPYPPINDLDLFSKKNFKPTIRRNLDTNKFETPNARKIYSNTVWLHHRALLVDIQLLDKLVKLIENIAICLKN